MSYPRCFSNICKGSSIAILILSMYSLILTPNATFAQSQPLPPLELNKSSGLPLPESPNVSVSVLTNDLPKELPKNPDETVPVSFAIKNNSASTIAFSYWFSPPGLHLYKVDDAGKRVDFFAPFSPFGPGRSPYGNLITLYPGDLKVFKVRISAPILASAKSGLIVAGVECASIQTDFYVFSPPFKFPWFK